MKSLKNNATKTTSHTAGALRLSRASDRIARGIITALGWSAIIILVLICAFLFQGSIKAITHVGLPNMIGGKSWFPTAAEAEFGFLPSEVGSLWVTAMALLVCVPIGVLAALYLSEFASPRVKEVGKMMVEFIAAIPSVVFGLMGLTFLVPWIQRTLGLESGLTALCAGLMVGFMVLPTIISISEDAMHAVPDDLRRGALALGNTRWQTALKIVLPAASSGIFAAIMLGLGRAIGETMIVLMLAGNAGIIPHSPFLAARTMTGTIAQETGEVVRGGLHYSVLFSMGLVLFAQTFFLNLIAGTMLDRQKRKWQRS